MICTTIQNKSLDEIWEVLESGDVEMAEIRLDRCPLTADEIEELFSASDVPLVATCRIAEVRKRLEREMKGTAVLDDAGSIHTEDQMTASRRDSSGQEAYTRQHSDDRKLDTKAVQEAEARLITAIHSGAAFADLEIEAPPMMSKRLRRETRENGTVFVRSYHDFIGTDSVEALKALTEKCFAIGADIAKIVTTAIPDSEADATAAGRDSHNASVARVLSLYDYFDPAKLIAFAMGEAGRESRIQCLSKGAPYTYAALNESEAAAPGQLTTARMREIVYGGESATKGEQNVIQMPASKSFAQRAIIAAALSEGTSVLNGYSPCGDSESAISVARALGAEVTVGLAYKDGKVIKDTSALTIKGRGTSAFTLESLHTGESGLLTRLMIPLLAVLGRGEVEITGEKTLTRRPLKGSREIMGAFGVKLENVGMDNADADEVFVPLRITGRLESGKVTVSGAGGSQLISGLLMALPLLQEDTVIRLTEPKSIPYLFITMDVMKAFGVKVWCDMEGGQEFAESQDWNDCTEIVLHIKGGQSYKATDMDIEGDWSSAANFLVAGAVFGRAAVSGLDTKSLQADLSVMDILMEAGASLSQLGDDDPKGIIHVQKAPLNAFEVDADNCPDLFPIIAVLAAFCQGTSRISGVGRLASKESDRGKAIVSMLTQLGVKARISGDKMIIEGHSLAQRRLTGHLLKGGNYTSSHDHRMVMALKVAELGADSPVVVDDVDCVAKSFPSFMELFGRLKKQL